MGLEGYGLLVGKIVASRPPRKGSPHWLLFVQPDTPGHSPYPRGCPTSDRAARHRRQALRFQAVDLSDERRKLAQKLRALGATPSFELARGNADVPTLDYVRDGWLDAKKFKDAGEALAAAFGKAVGNATGNAKAPVRIAVFGTGTPIDRATGAAPGTGFQGVENVHMNQGSFHRVGGTRHFLENASHQDGGIVFFDDKTAQGFFLKFASQTLDTLPDGHPAGTGIKEIDQTPKAVRDAIMPPRRARSASKPMPLISNVAKHKGVSPTLSASPIGFVFMDQNPNDADEAFVADDDRTTARLPMQ